MSEHDSPGAERDDVIELNTGPTRRRFLRAFAAAGAGVAGLKAAIERAVGDVDGVPLVWTRDRFGNPDKVRMVSKERYRRLELYRTLDVAALEDRHGGVNGVTLEERSSDPDDLRLKFYLDRNTRAARRKLPGRIDGVPVTFEERTRDRTPARVCDRRVLNFYDPLPANPEITGRDIDGNHYGTGTLGLVAWNTDANNPYEVFVTAHHVVHDSDEGGTASRLQHGGTDDDGNSRSEYVGDYDTHSPLGDYGMDAARYRNTGAVTPDTLETASDKQGTVSGAWTFSGLSDATSGTSSIYVDYAGRSTCWDDSQCVDTERNNLIDYQATISPSIGTDGDSGGPFMDADDKLVCTYSTTCCEEDHGPVAQEMMDRIGVQLYPPNIEPA